MVRHINEKTTEASQPAAGSLDSVLYPLAILGTHTNQRSWKRPPFLTYTHLHTECALISEWAKISLFNLLLRYPLSRRYTADDIHRRFHPHCSGRHCLRQVLQHKLARQIFLSMIVMIHASSDQWSKLWKIADAFYGCLLLYGTTCVKPYDNI